MNVLAEDSGGGATGIVGEDEHPEQVIQASHGGQEDKAERPGVDVRRNSFSFLIFLKFLQCCYCSYTLSCTLK